MGTWSFILEAGKTLPKLNIIIAMRPLLKPPVEFYQITKGWSFNVNYIKLSPLSKDEIAEVWKAHTLVDMILCDSQHGLRDKRYRSG